ncbi:MAG: ExbD/TolR family protein [Steroidobacteraceae bacterium]
MAVSVSGDSSDPMVEPNVIPLVDVMLVLLIIMIITVPVITDAVKIDLPVEMNQPTVTTPENINVAVDFDGQIYWNDSPVSEEDFLARTLQNAILDPQPEVHIRADKRVRYEYVAKVLFNLQRGGMMKVGFIAEPPAGTS